jgi:hypothetical protein
MANPLPPLALFCSSAELGWLLLPLGLAVAAGSVHSIMYLYFVVKFQWSAVHIGLFLSTVGVVTAMTQGVLLPLLVPKLLTVRRAIPWGLAIHALEYALFAYCSQGWMLVLVLVVCCCEGLEPPALHALISAEVPPHQQGALHGALASVRTLVSVVSVPLFAQLFAWAVGTKVDELPDAGASLVQTQAELELADSLKDVSASDWLCALGHAAGSELARNCTAAANEVPAWAVGEAQGGAAEGGEGAEGGEMLMGDFGAFAYENGHLEAPFLVAASLFACAGLAALAVLAAFPKLGRGELKSSEPGL